MNNSNKRTLGSYVRRWLRILAAIVGVLFALLVFPNRIPESAGIWLVVCTFRSGSSNTEKGNSISISNGWLLAMIPVWLAFKWPEPTVAMFLFVAAVILCAFSNGSFCRKLSIAVWATWFIWLVHHHRGSSGPIVTNPVKPPKASPVVCLGDSLTAFGYPQELEKLLSVPVVDFGVSGIKTAEGRRLVPEIIALNPQVVVLELGGHDYNSGNSRSTAAGNMRAMIEAFQKANAAVLIVEIPRGVVIDPWYGLERELAREYNLQLVPDTMIRRLAYWSPVLPPGSLVRESFRLSDDGIHPNASGNRMMAETIAPYTTLEND